MKLYKYHAVNKDSLSALVRKKVWVPKPRTFNDPFDCAATVFQIDSASGHILFKSGDSNAIATLAAGIITGPTTKEQKEWLTRMGVYSLSARNDSRLMWAHYADQFRGYCLEFAFDDSSFADLVSVDYDPNNENPTIDGTEDPMSLIKGVARQKAYDWKYEEEYRWVVQDGDRYYERPAPITGVILGSRCKPEDKTTIKELLGPEVHHRHVIMVPKSFNFTIEDDLCA